MLSVINFVETSISENSTMTWSYNMLTMAFCNKVCKSLEQATIVLSWMDLWAKHDLLEYCKFLARWSISCKFSSFKNEWEVMSSIYGIFRFLWFKTLLFTTCYIQFLKEYILNLSSTAQQQNMATQPTGCCDLLDSKYLFHALYYKIDWPR